jgi:hypothetical protein
VAKRTIQTLEQEKGLLRQELVAHQDTSKSKVKTEEEEPEVVHRRIFQQHFIFILLGHFTEAAGYCRSERSGPIPYC